MLENFCEEWKKEAILFYELLCSCPNISHDMTHVKDICLDYSQLFSSAFLQITKISFGNIERVANNILYLEWRCVNNELSRLLFYVSLLPVELKYVIEKHYFYSFTISVLEETLHCSRRTVIRRRECAVMELTKMYNYYCTQ